MDEFSYAELGLHFLCHVSYSCTDHGMVLGVGPR